MYVIYISLNALKYIFTSSSFILDVLLKGNQLIHSVKTSKTKWLNTLEKDEQHISVRFLFLFLRDKFSLRWLHLGDTKENLCSLMLVLSALWIVLFGIRIPLKLNSLLLKVVIARNVLHPKAFILSQCKRNKNWRN